MWKEAVVAYFEIRSRYSPKGTDKSAKNPSLGPDSKSTPPENKADYP
jgi:hypothetical protein